MSNQAKYCFAVDLGGTTAKCAIIKDEIIEERFIVETQIGQVLENIKSVFDEKIVKYNIEDKDLEFVAITICGLIDYENGISIWTGNLEWSNFEVVKFLKELFHNENVFILNDSKAATYGEYVKGLNKEKPNMLLYTLGTGIGGGVILNSELYFGGNTKLASEPGHSGGFQNKYQCNCGLIGCIEGLSSATGIEKEINKNHEYYENKLGLNKDKYTIKDIAELFYNGDKKTVELFEECFLPLVKHMAVSIHLMDFDMVVIGGGPSAMGDHLLNLLKKQLKNYLMPPFYEKLDLRIAKLRNDAGLWGVYHFAKLKLDELKK
ncbi:glucokinase [Spiroplasma chinense]|uniref:Glucokinase n=1 Tax=Spiroplasma chinense TaxID=216932 RepID=A0A5B9Y603_9MOLU|nr:ROK family protein [Spiroplasma chinense]QEH61472.1 glucokinase [Spiroplasma chinense]